MALLEALVALTILGISGIGLLEWAAEVRHAAAQARASELEMQRAARLLEAASLWPVTEIDQRQGTRAQGPFRMRIIRTSEALYHVTVGDSLSGRVLLETTIYRPASATAR